jgi:hypothetical protein
MTIYNDKVLLRKRHDMLLGGAITKGNNSVFFKAAQEEKTLVLSPTFSRTTLF